MRKWWVWPSIGPTLPIWNISHCSTSYLARSVAGMNLPVLAARYTRMAPDSNSEIGFPSGPCGSVMAGILLFGLIFRNSGLNWSPAPMLTGMARYGRPHSSSMMWTLWPLGVGQEKTSIMRDPLLCLT